MNKLVVYSKSFWYNTNDGINFSKNANDGKRVVPINLFFFKKRIVSSAQTLSRQDPLDVGFGLSGDLSGLLASLQPTHSMLSPTARCSCPLVQRNPAVR
jgi:hypothetical protein